MVQTVAEALELKFSRIQFTPDLMPSDITGTEIIEEDATTGKRGFRFVRGPVFANIVLADEVNPHAAQTQAALLQAMQEHQVTAGGQTHSLPSPSSCWRRRTRSSRKALYPLPEAQLDRFMFELRVPTRRTKKKRRSSRPPPAISQPTCGSCSPRRTSWPCSHLVRRIPRLKGGARGGHARAAHPARRRRAAINEGVRVVGRGTAASQYLVLGAKARAALDGRPSPDFDDIRAVAPLVLNAPHRLELRR